MNFRLLLVFVMIAAASAGTSAQNTIDPGHLSLNTYSTVGIGIAGASGSSVADGNALSAKSAALKTIEQTAFRLINIERERAGLPALRWNEQVAELARLHSRHMADYSFFSHKDLDGRTVDGRAEELRLSGWQAIGENIAFLQNYADPAPVAVEKWLESASHRSNMMDAQWSDSAIGVAETEDGKCYFTQVFMLKK